MPDPRFAYRLYLVISEACCPHRNYLEVAEEAIRGGVDIIQLREKGLPATDVIAKAKTLKKMTDRHGIPLIINDNLDVARHIGAFGIHVGSRDVSPTVIRESWPQCRCLGYSVESLEQLEGAAAAAADYLAVSPVFRTETKTDTVTEWGLNGLATIRSMSTKPLVAIGHMNAGNAAAVTRAGADCIAVVSAICSAPDPREAAFLLKKIISNA
jgi:thiamine-phosphate pyrophosphorylase